LDTDRDLDNYIFIMTRNIVLNIFKHQQIEQEYQDEVIEKTFLYELTEKEEVLNNVYYKEMLMIIQLTLEKMPKRRRLIFELSRFRGLSHKEIADKLDVSIRTIEHQVYLALIELKKILILFIFFLKYF
jgi:RNA polymerase sigma-70 factor (ECF subfamily)